MKPAPKPDSCTHHLTEVDTAGYGEDKEYEYRMVRCTNQAAICLDGDWICWEHAESEYGFDTGALVD